METGYKDIAIEEEAFNKFSNTAQQVILEVCVLPEREVALVRHRTHYNQPSLLIAAAFPHAGKERHEHMSIQTSHPGREVMNTLGKNTMYSAFTNNEWNCDRFVIIPLSEKSRIQKLLSMPHVEWISSSDIQEAEEIYKGLVEHNEYGHYDHRDNLRAFGLKPEQVEIDAINSTISINAEGDSDVGANATLGSFLKDLEIMGFKKATLNLSNTMIYLGDYKTIGKDLPADFSDPYTWLPEFKNPMKLSINVEGCRNIRNSSDIVIYKN